MAEKVKLSKDGNSIDFAQSENLPTSVKKFRQSLEIQGFYRFIFENDLQKEAFVILERIVNVRKAKKKTEKVEAAAIAQAAKKAEISAKAEVVKKTPPIEKTATMTKPIKLATKKMSAVEKSTTKEKPATKKAAPAAKVAAKKVVPPKKKLTNKK